MQIKIIDADFSVCKVKDFSQVNFNDTFLFIGKTDEENSLVCQSKYVPSNILECESGWNSFRIQGVLDFSLVGILSKVSTLLAENEISIYAVSTFNTDYILVKADVFEKAISILIMNGYTVLD